MGRRSGYWFTVILLAALCVVALYFNFSNSASDDDKPPLSLRFSLAGIPACATISPAFDWAMPADTRLLSFMMTDLNMPAFHHGGSTVAYTGNVVSRGAVPYTAPCAAGRPPQLSARRGGTDPGGKVLGKGSAEAIVSAPDSAPAKLTQTR